MFENRQVMTKTVSMSRPNYEIFIKDAAYTRGLISRYAGVA